MEWSTPVSIVAQQGAVTHHHRMMLFGSCFAEYMGARLLEYHFPVDVNPFGIQYNPFSIAASIERLMSGEPFTGEELFRDGNLWHSFSHHSSFSHTDKALCLQQINDRLLPAAALLAEADYLILTWGTSWVYTLSMTAVSLPIATSCLPPVLCGGNCRSTRCTTSGVRCSGGCLTSIPVCGCGLP